MTGRTIELYFRCHVIEAGPMFGFDQGLPVIDSFVLDQRRDGRTHTRQGPTSAAGKKAVVYGRLEGGIPVNVPRVAPSICFAFAEMTHHD